MRMPEVMIAILLVLLLAGCKEEKLARGETAPALAAFDLQGKPASLERWEGGVSQLLVGQLRRLSRGNGYAADAQPTLAG